MENKLRMNLTMTTARLVVTLAIMQVSTVAVAHKSNNERLDAIDARMLKVERVANSEALVKMSQKISAMQREIQQLRGENEQLTHELNSLKTRQREQFLDIDRRLQTSSGGVMINNSGTSDGVLLDNSSVQATQSTGVITSTDQQVATTTTNSATVATTTSNDAAQDYKNAFTLLKQGKYDDSIVAFNGFLQTHSASKYASNAQYWLAEANYVSKRYPQALAEFTKVIEQYPASSKVADAKLKLGFTHYELGQYEQSRVELTRLRAQFPNSSVASLAQQRLERMAREGH